MPERHRRIEEAAEELDSILGLDGLASDVEAAALLLQARIAQVEGRHPAVARLQARAMEACVRGAAWIVDEETDANPAPDEVLTTVDLHDPGSWTLSTVELTHDETGDSIIGCSARSCHGDGRSDLPPSL